MAIEILQLDPTHQYFESTFDLDGELFRLTTRYNARIDSWMASLYDALNNPIALGRRITVNNLLFPWLVGQNRPAGQLIAVDTQDEDHDPGENDLGTRVVIYYADSDELVSLGANVG